MSSFDLGEFDPAYGLRPEFGELARQAGRARNARSSAQVERAENLLRKAARRIEAGDADAAERFLTRAAAIPWDDNDEWSPCIHGASMLLYTPIADAQENSPMDDSGWLDRSLDVLARIDGRGRSELASILHGFVIQRDLFDLTTDEISRIRAVAGDAPLEAEHGDVEEISVEAKVEIVRSIVLAVLEIERAYEGLSPRL